MPPTSMHMPSWHMEGKLHPSFALHYNYGTLSFSNTGKSPNKGTDNIPFFAFFSYIYIEVRDWVHVSTILIPRTWRMGDPQSQNVNIGKESPSSARN